MRPTEHKIGHFGNVSPSQPLGLVWKKIYVTQKSMHSPIKQKMYYNTKLKKPKPGLVAFYDIWPGNEVGLFSKEKISKGGVK